MTAMLGKGPGEVDMPLTRIHNLMADRTALHLGNLYAELATSIRRLSSGLGGAADAAGPAGRELLRADVASVNPRSGNAGDATPLLRTAEGTMAAIREKLIRMKALAGQAGAGKPKAHSGSDNLSAEDDRYLRTVAERQMLWGVPAEDSG